MTTDIINQLANLEAQRQACEATPETYYGHDTTPAFRRCDQQLSHAARNTDFAAIGAELERVRQVHDQLSDCLDDVRKILDERTYASRLNQLEAIRAAITMDLPETKADQLELENRRLRQILARVPARIAIEAKEKVGFGTAVVPASTPERPHA